MGINLRYVDREVYRQEDEQEYELEVKESTSTIKKFHANDLPLYFKWHCYDTWYYKVFVKDGRLLCIKISKEVNGGGFEFKTLEPTNAFVSQNVPIGKSEWDEVQTELINYITNNSLSTK
jgi:hypothetical protein